VGTPNQSPGVPTSTQVGCVRTFEIIEIISGSSFMYFHNELYAEICRPKINGSSISAFAIILPHIFISFRIASRTAFYVIF
jgi:hypothetical protein